MRKGEIEGILKILWILAKQSLKLSTPFFYLHSMKKNAKRLSLILLLIVLAIPLVWFHIVELREVEDLENAKTQLEGDLKLCEEAAEVDELGLFYELNGLDVTAEAKEVTFAELFTAESLEAQAVGDCAKTVDEGYFDTLASAFEGVKGTQYSFKANSTETEVYTVTLFPNTTSYGTFESFRNDFEICAVGGEAYPIRLNEEALMFGSGCGAAYVDETPVLTCSDIAKELTLEFN